MKCNVSTVLPISPYRLHQEYRDFWTEAQARLVERVDPILKADCFRPRWYHAPDTVSELAGVPGNGYLEFTLYIPAGSWLLGYAHAESVALRPFLVQITDVGLDYQFFNQPVEDAYFTNPGVTGGGPARLLTRPYPVTPPGQLRFQFWNQAAALNKFVQLALLVAEPLPTLQG